jgi:hypothetical protein
MYQLAAKATTNGALTSYAYGSLALPTAAATWDAEMIFGCYCDHGYFTKPDRSGVLSYYCAALQCPRGDNPSTPTYEVQTLTCTASSGTFTLTFDDGESHIDQATAAIAFDATAAAVEAAIELLSSVAKVTVAFGTGTAACSGSGVAISVTFTAQYGDVNAFTADVTELGGGTVTIAETTKGSITQSFETQTLTCTSVAGSFTISFRGETTAVRLV